MRLFTAIRPSPAAEEVLLAAQAELRLLGRGSFPRREMLHLTLAFLGETADAAAKIKVACVGDSLTEGYTSTGANSGKKGPNAYPARLQSLLGSGYEVKKLWGNRCVFDGGDK